MRSLVELGTCSLVSYLKEVIKCPFKLAYGA